MPDQWGGEDQKVFDHFTASNGDRVMRGNVNGTAVVIFSYAEPHTPQIIAYPNSQKSMAAYEAFRARYAGELELVDLRWYVSAVESPRLQAIKLTIAEGRWSLYDEGNKLIMDLLTEDQARSYLVERGYVWSRDRVRQVQDSD